MPESPRKKSHIVEREAFILKIAGEILAQEGVAALTMDRVLARVDFSKGTLYNHFTCREDLLVAFHTQCFAEHHELFSRGALFRGRPRERFLAAAMGDEIKHRLDPFPASMIMTEAILTAASERWRESFTSTLRETVGVFVGIVRDAIVSGDLDAAHDPEVVAASSWAIWVGAEELRNAGMILRAMPERDFQRCRSAMVATLLDGYGWRPLSTKHDYDAVHRRALDEIYAPEARKLGLL